MGVLRDAGNIPMWYTHAAPSVSVLQELRVLSIAYSSRWVHLFLSLFCFSVSEIAPVRLVYSSLSST